MRKFQAKVKVARKSHVKKDPEAGEVFKKTLISAVKKSATSSKKNTKQ